MSQKLKAEVEMLKRVLTPEHSEIHVHFSYGNSDEPHGPFGGNTLIRIINPDGSEEHRREADSFAEEIHRYSKTAYDDMIKHNKFMKAKDHPFSTYEKWVNYYRCKCGKHGVHGDQPFTGITNTATARGNVVADKHTN